MKKRSIVILIMLGIVILVIGIIILFKNKSIKEKAKLVIIDATYACAQTTEKFYEDDKYIYAFPCVKSNSVFVKFENGNKMLVTDALTSKKVTIDELLDAGLEVYKYEK